VVQLRVAEKLIALLQEKKARPARILDIGAGTGRVLAKLRELYPEALAVGADLALGMCRAAKLSVTGVEMVNADAERLPFAPSSFDLVISTSTFQWLSTLDRTFAEVTRVLSPGGLFCFALFGEGTLFELRDAYHTALGGGADRSHSFFSRGEVLSALRRQLFTQVKTRALLEVEFHPSVPELLRSLKRIGAGSAAPVAARGLSQRRVMLEMMERYLRKYGRNGTIPASYQVIYGFGRKKGGSS
jgi:malonyl-CoA O-methyltransferase